MSVAIESSLSNLATPRSPISITTNSSRSNSLKQTLPNQQPEPPTPTSPKKPLGRKRAASLNADTVETGLRGFALSCAGSVGVPASDHSMRERLCLCQPDPKIPRPRNAFILFRQHYQAQVVAQNPGLANPEVSKVIGEKWKQQPPEVKADWKRLAEEEKQRHSKQYPGYRYQPRRAGKVTGIWSISASSDDDPIRCAKCNGRFISTPSSLSTPFTPAYSAASRNNRPQTTFAPTRLTEIKRPRYSTEMLQSRLDSTRPSQLQHRRSHFPPVQHIQIHHEKGNDMEFQDPSPGLKRRWFHEDDPRDFLAKSPMSYSPVPQYTRSGPPLSAGGYRQQLPGPGMLVQSEIMDQQLSQQPPIGHHARQNHAVRGSNFDESLRLPPLQAQMPSYGASNSQRPDAAKVLHEAHVRTVEAMIMTIPCVSKIKVLSKISPPLPAPGLNSSAQAVRGPLIAVEGADKELLANIGAFIEEHLKKEIYCTMQSWSTPEALAKLCVPSAIDVKSDTATLRSRNSFNSVLPEVVKVKDAFVDYLSIITEWHKKSMEIETYITTSPKSAWSSSESPKSKVIPVALTPNGFSLTTADAFAIRIPINDAYGPVDHWQWMATLWRGIIGPDLTILTVCVGQEETSKVGVELRSDCSAIVVRVQEGGMDEKTARRLRFEVSEFVRNAGNACYGKSGAG